MDNIAQARRRSSQSELLERYRFRELVQVMRPTLPPLEEFTSRLEEIWKSRWLTNNGSCHHKLERRLAEYLGVEHLSLFCNGTIALWTALRVLGIDEGEVITTPFTFPATLHVLSWSGLEPVFCDIEESTLNLDPERLEDLVGPRTRAIMPVHVYGTPCRHDAIRGIAGSHELPVVYDAAHTFGAAKYGQALASLGDVSMLSFHATKLFSTVEGGALVFSTAEQKRAADLLKNFGIVDAETVDRPGINGKLNELQAAYGLIHLESIGHELEQRSRIAKIYREELGAVPGLRLLPAIEGLRRNWSYFPILVDEAEYGLGRDRLYEALIDFNVVTRKYFYPLCSNYECYSALPTAQPERLPVANRAAEQVLCLPIYGTLELADARTIGLIIRELPEAYRSA